MPFEERTLAEDDEFSSLKLPEQLREGSSADKFAGAESDESLLDLGREGSGHKDGSENGHDEAAPGCAGAGKGSSSSPSEPAGKNQQAQNLSNEGQNPRDPFSYEKVTEEGKGTSGACGGIEAELRALQNEVLQPTARNDFHLPQPKMDAENDSSQQDDAKLSSVTKEESIEDLLKLDDPMNLAEGAAEPDGSLLVPNNGDKFETHEKDPLVSEWDNFSSFMPSTRDGTRSPLAGWESEFMSMSQPAAPSLPDALIPEKVQDMPAVETSSQTVGNSVNSPADSSNTSTPAPTVLPDSTPGSSKKNNQVLDQRAQATGASDAAQSKSFNVDELLGLGTGSGFGSQPTQSSTANEILSAELKAMGISVSSAESGSNSESTKSSKQLPVASNPQQQPGLEDIDPTMFHASAQLQPTGGMSPQMMGQAMFRSPLGPAQAPPVFPLRGPMGMVGMPPRFGLGHPGLSSGAMMGARASMGPSTANPDAAKEGKEGKDGSKEKTWLNFFADLDPLSNEKA